VRTGKERWRWVEYRQKRELIEIRVPSGDGFDSYWGKPICGGVFGFGEWALVADADLSFSLPTLVYRVMHARSGLSISVAWGGKAEALAEARMTLRTCEPHRLSMTIDALIAKARALDEALELAAKQRVSEAGRALMPDPPKRDKSGYVYLIQCDGRYKIGKALDVATRLRSIPLPAKPEVIATGHFPEPHVVERELHKQFREARLHGEWFALAAEDVAAVMDRLADGKVEAGEPTA
jgi:hypothetical protein